jgi:hypothetical protein
MLRNVTTEDGISTVSWELNGYTYWPCPPMALLLGIDDEADGETIDGDNPA